MIVLHKNKDDETSLDLEKKLEELIISYKTEIHDSHEKELLYIEEDGVEYREEGEIEEWLDELKSDLNTQRSISGDGCYIDPKNDKIC